MRNRRFKDEGAHSYWQSVTDALTGLVLVLLLILMLFMVRILYYSNVEDPGTTEHDEPGDYRYEDGYDYRREGTDGTGWYPAWQGGGGGGGADGEVRVTPEPTPSPSPTPTASPIPEVNGETGYAAVLVQLVDADSQNRVEEAGVRFELGNEDHRTLELKTYYPEETTYRYFDTRDNGTWFVPEKLPLGEYTLRNLTCATGYNLAAEVDFTVDEDHDWSDPLVVTAYVGPEKNELAIQLVDTHGSRVYLPGEFAVYANTDIITADGTKRFSANEWVDTILCDERGTGTSRELYLGEYRIETHFEQDVYVGNRENVVTLYSRNTENGRVPHSIVCEKTRIAVQLVDELQTTLPLSGGEYELRRAGTNEVQTAVTDSTGRLEFTDLAKDSTYELRQLQAPSRYYEDSETHSLYVDRSGYIDGEACYTLTRTNRTIRIQISLVDAWLRKPVEDMNVNLYDAADQLVLSYRATGEKKQIDGLDYGSYRLEVENTDTVWNFEVANTAERQSFTVPVKVQSSMYLLLGIGGLVLAAAVTGIVLVCKKRKKR